MSNQLATMYRQLFIEDTPLIDLRAPIEFEKGAFPCSINLPLMSDQERSQVGKCYKNFGQQSALELGHRLVSGEIKSQRIKSWMSQLNQSGNSAKLYCFRGGLRSRISQQWLAQVGFNISIIEGGYKALRGFLIEETSRIIQSTPISVLSGYTGSGKTKLLTQYKFAIDLEGLANHRGSSFGMRLSGQPSQINFENNLAVKLIKHQFRAEKCLLLEDEGRMIGARSIPTIVKQQMDSAQLILIEENIDFRIEQIYRDYVVNLYQEFVEVYAQDGLNQYHQFLNLGVQKIAKRLGGTNSQTVKALIDKAIDQQQRKGHFEGHQDWIRFLLESYYDPMYAYQIDNKSARVSVRGDSQLIADYLSQYLT